MTGGSLTRNGPLFFFFFPDSRCVARPPWGFSSGQQFFVVSESVFGRGLDPFRAPEPLPILNPINFVPKNGFPVLKELSCSQIEG